ncbi:MAG: hypothetical protein FJ125_10780, partial [Deltaproteobacteria bacterium]|nr:hypothetical protein [Deltaproteobacteria bacterium]
MAASGDVTHADGSAPALDSGVSTRRCRARHRGARCLVALVLLMAILASAASSWAAGEPPARAPAADPCAGRLTTVVVRTEEHRLWLCLRGRSAADYAVAIGKGGTGKRQEGDGKTPLGVYPLGVPYTSSKFHLFVPVGYPTAEQQRQGYTGGSVGIHGPARGLSFFGRLTTLVDWT